METNTNYIISVKDLVKEYNDGKVTALSHCNLDVKKGEVVAIIGPSGSGKSTLLRSLNLLEEPTSGEIFFEGVNLASKDVDINLHRQKMGMVFQHFNLFPHKTILENITLAPIKLLKKDKAEAEKEAETEVIIKAGIQEGQSSGRLEFRDMVLIRSTFEVSIGGRVLPKITKQEFAILELLLKNPKQVFSKEDIFEYAWDEPYMGETKTLDVHISNIRKKIKNVTPDEYIETIWGIGYRLHE